MVEQMRLHSFTIMSKILIPATVWKAGNPLVKIRKAGITCMIQLIRRQIISEEVLQEVIFFQEKSLIFPPSSVLAI